MKWVYWGGDVWKLTSDNNDLRAYYRTSKAFCAVYLDGYSVIVVDSYGTPEEFRTEIEKAFS